MVNAPSPSVPSRPPRWLFALLPMLLVLVVVFGLILWVAPSPQAGSTYSRSLTGYRGWYDYMIEQRRPVKRWQQSYDQLTGSGQTLIRIGKRTGFTLGTFDPNSFEQEEALQTWVNNGNTVIVLSWQGQVTAAPFISQLSAGSDRVQVETTRRYVPKPSPLPGLEQVSTFARANEPEIKPELRDDFGLVVWSSPNKDGTLIECVYPWLAANALVDQTDNYRFLASLAQRRQGPIWVDEWMHGHRDPVPNDEQQPDAKAITFLDYLARTPVAVMVAQVGFIGLLLVWGHNHRFGALETLKPEAKDASEQYIQALASTLNAARKTDFAAQTLRQYFQRTLATQLGLMSLSGHSLPDPDQISTHWANLTGRPARELLELLQPSVRSDRELLAWVATVESLLRELP
ncbi:MAG: DUF4350 domain-containing protein [Thermosynechococcaceae cyanobacterium]